jgi:hypothetical protein
MAAEAVLDAEDENDEEAGGEENGDGEEAIVD